MAQDPQIATPSRDVVTPPARTARTLARLRGAAPTGASRPIVTGPERSALRRLAEVRGLVGGLTMPHVDVVVRTEDGVRLRGSLLTGPAGAPALVLAHGFGAHRRKPAYALLADALAQAFHVLTIDLRGHGQSAGTSTLGGSEALDLEAAVRDLRSRGHAWVGAVGVSMGATALLTAVGRGRVDLDAAVAVSGPPHLHEVPRTDPMRRLHRLWTSPPHRVALRLVAGIRLVEVDRFVAPPHPAQVVAAGPDLPLLLVHGTDDHFFPIDEWEGVLAAAPRGAADLWRLPGFGHAEDGIGPAFAAALSDALRDVAASNTFPPAPDGWRPR